jgi:hypothetical protein
MGAHSPGILGRAFVWSYWVSIVFTVLGYLHVSTISL